MLGGRDWTMNRPRDGQFRVQSRPVVPTILSGQPLATIRSKTGHNVAFYGQNLARLDPYVGHENDEKQRRISALVQEVRISEIDERGSTPSAQGGRSHAR